MWFGRAHNPLWRKLHQHIAPEKLNLWSSEHQVVMDALLTKNSQEVKQCMWQHLESTKEFLYNASSANNTPYDKYLFQDDALKMSNNEL